MAAAGTDSPEEEVLFGGALDVRAGGTGGAWRSGVWAQLMTSTLLLSGGVRVRRANGRGLLAVSKGGSAVHVGCWVRRVWCGRVCVCV